MIIDCDTHLMPSDAFERIEGEFGLRKPTLKFDQDGRYVDVDFPEYPEVPGTSPLLAPGSGAMHSGFSLPPIIPTMIRAEG
jgi:hypothetical protein